MTNIQCFLTNEYHPIHEGPGNREIDHQLNKLLIVKNILLLSTLEDAPRTVWRICVLMLLCNGKATHKLDLRHSIEMYSIK